MSFDANDGPKQCVACQCLAFEHHECPVCHSTVGEDCALWCERCESWVCRETCTAHSGSYADADERWCTRCIDNYEPNAAEMEWLMSDNQSASEARDRQETARRCRR